MCEVVKVLLANGAHIEAMIQGGATSLHLASQNGYVEVVKLLIANKANVEAVDKFGRTALFYSAQKEKEDVCHCILKLFYSLTRLTDPEIHDSRRRLFTGLLCLEKTPISQDQFYKILLSVEELRNDVARILIDELQKNHDITYGSLLAYKEVRAHTANFILERHRISLTTIYENLDAANCLKVFFDPTNPEQILSCIREGLDNCIEERLVRLKNE